MELKFRSAETHNLVMINTDLYDFLIQEMYKGEIRLIAQVTEASDGYWVIAKDKEKYKLERIFEIIENAIEQGEKLLDLTKYTIMDE